jgi:hypothetical protein
MTGQEVLRQLLPADVEVPTSFETIGHVLHLNLKEQVLALAAAPLILNCVTFEGQHTPYERVIADVLLDKVIATALRKCRVLMSCAAGAQRAHHRQQSRHYSKQVQGLRYEGECMFDVRFMYHV